MTYLKEAIEIVRKRNPLKEVVEDFHSQFDQRYEDVMNKYSVKGTDNETVNSLRDEMYDLMDHDAAAQEILDKLSELEAAVEQNVREENEEDNEDEIFRDRINDFPPEDDEGLDAKAEEEIIKELEPLKQQLDAIMAKYPHTSYDDVLHWLKR